MTVIPYRTRKKTISDLYHSRKWSDEEYAKFILEIRKKQDYYYAIQLMYHCGIRVGEMMALTVEDIDFNEKVISITKAYMKKRNGQGVITNPKTPECIRIVRIPEQIAVDLKQYLDSKKQIERHDRIFSFSQNSLRNVVNKGADVSGVKRIPIHGICADVLRTNWEEQLCQRKSEIKRIDGEVNQ